MVFGQVTQETPKFTVVRSLPNGAELRRYETLLVAQYEWTPSTSDPMKSNGEPFRALAKYIGVFGEAQNERKDGSTSQTIAMTAPVLMGDAPSSSEKISMTAPVLMGDTTEGNGAGRYMRFVLPSELTLETAPTPTNPRVKLVQVPAKLVAALRFSGRIQSANIDAHGGKLLDAIAADGELTPVSEEPTPWYYGGFNPPFTLPFLRTNEVYVDVLDGRAGERVGVSAPQRQAAAAAQKQAAQVGSPLALAAGLAVTAGVVGATVWRARARSP